MGCTASRDAVAAAAARPRGAAAPSSPPGVPRRARRRADPGPAKLCRERAALARAVADRRSALAAAHAAYFRSLVPLGCALRRFAAAALAPPPSVPPAFARPPPSPVATATATAPSSSTVSPLTDSSSFSHEHIDAPRPDAKRHGGGGGGKKASSSTTTARLPRMMRNSSTIPTLVYEDPYARPQYAEGEARYGYVYGDGEVLSGEERPGPSPPSPPAAASLWDGFNPFVDCDGFVENYYRSHRRGGCLHESSSSFDSAEQRRMEGIPELEEETVEASPKPSTSRDAGDRNAKANNRCPGNAASNRDPSGGGGGGTVQRTGPEPAAGGADGEVAGKRPASSKPHSVPKGGCTKEGAARFKKPVSNRDAVPNGSSQEGETKKKKNDTVDVGGMNNGTGSSSSRQQQKKKAAVMEEGEPPRSPTARREGRGHGEPNAARSAAASSPLSPMVLPTRSVAAAMDEVYWLFNEAANRGVAVSRVLGPGKAAVARRAKLRLLKFISCRAVSTAASSCHPKPRGSRNSRAPRITSSTSSSAASCLLGTARRTNDGHELSSTLEKLWVCEEKLYREIKYKDKLRKQYKKVQGRLKSLGQRGAESSLIGSAQRSASLLRSKISVSVCTAAGLAAMVAKVRDAELLPQLADLIQRLRALWKALVQCHEKQLSAMQGADVHRLKAAMSGGSGAASMASEDLDRELKNWRRCFDKWITSQRSFVQALNRWLQKWLLLLPEEDEEGTSPQPAFVVCKKWLQATEKVPAAEATADHFSALVRELRKRQDAERRQRRRAEQACRDYRAKQEDLAAALGLIIACPDGIDFRRGDERVRDLARARRRRDEEGVRHAEVLRQAHDAAAAAVPFGLVPLLQQMVGFFQGSLHAYMEIGTMQDCT